MSSPLRGTTATPVDAPHTGDTYDGDVNHIYEVSVKHGPRLGDRALCGHKRQDPHTYATNAEARKSGRPICGRCIIADKTNQTPWAP